MGSCKEKKLNDQMKDRMNCQQMKIGPNFVNKKMGSSSMNSKVIKIRYKGVGEINVANCYCLGCETRY